MERLTYKSNTQIEFGDDTPYSEMYVSMNDNEAIQKLGMLEDIEEELGCPIEVVFRALRDGIYTNVYGALRYVRLEKHIDNYLFDDSSYSVGTKGYKRTWWLREDKSE